LETLGPSVVTDPRNTHLFMCCYAKFFVLSQTFRAYVRRCADKMGPLCPAFQDYSRSLEPIGIDRLTNDYDVIVGRSMPVGSNDLELIIHSNCMDLYLTVFGKRMGQRDFGRKSQFFL